MFFEILVKLLHVYIMVLVYSIHSGIDVFRLNELPYVKNVSNQLKKKLNPWIFYYQI